MNLYQSSERPREKIQLSFYISTANTICLQLKLISCCQSLKLKNAANLSYSLEVLRIMSCYLNINLSKFNPEGKFKFPEKI